MSGLGVLLTPFFMASADAGNTPKQPDVTQPTTTYRQPVNREKPQKQGFLVAKAGDWSITLDEIDKKGGEQLYELSKQLYDLRMRTLFESLTDHFIELEAKSLSIPKEQFIATQIDSKVDQVKEKDIDQLLTKFRTHLRPGEKISRDEIRGYLESKQREKALHDFMNAMIGKHELKLGLRKPVIPEFTRTEIKTKAVLSKGPVDAPVKIVKFADFECGYCKKAAVTLSELENQYRGKLRIEYHHFPLDNHPGAKIAAEASYCANDQGKFWPFHDAIYGLKGRITPQSISEVAANIKLNKVEFDQCLSSGKHQASLQDDITEGKRLGIAGTPIFYINGRPIRGAQPYTTFTAMINEELQKQPVSTAQSVSN